MITLEQYFGRFMNHSDATPERKANAVKLLNRCEELQKLALSDAVVFLDNPNTESEVSGSIYGGFRPQDCPQGAPHSSHKEGLAVDIYDPKDEIDTWCMANQEKLEQCGIYIEHPDATHTWSHWTIRAPKSGKRVFFP